MADTITALGRAPIGINQQQGGDDYPFVSPPASVRQVFADMSLVYRDDTARFVRPFRVSYLYGFGAEDAPDPAPAYTRAVCIVDAVEEVVFDSREETLEQTTWGDRFEICRWTGEDAALTVTAYTSWQDDETITHFPVEQSPVGAVLDERVSVRAPKQVRSIAVDGDTVVGNIRGCDLRLANGWNTLLQPLPIEYDVSGRPFTPILVSAEAGSGRGRFEAACDDNARPPIRHINGVPGANGNFTLDAEGCYRVERPLVDNSTTVVQTGTLKLANDCDACCECSDYAAVYEAVRNTHTAVESLITRIQAVRDRYVVNLTKYLRSQACRDADKLRLVLEAECPNRVGVASGFVNNTAECITNLIVLVSFEYVEGDLIADTTYTGDPTHVCNSSYRSGNTESGQGNSGSSSRRSTKPSPYRLYGAYPHFWAHFDQVQPGATASVTWRQDFPDAAPGEVVEAVTDAYALTTPYVPNANTSISPIPGHTLGEGPTGGALDLRLVDSPSKASVTLVDSDELGVCCQ